MYASINDIRERVRACYHAAHVRPAQLRNHFYFRACLWHFFRRRHTRSPSLTLHLSAFHRPFSAHFSTSLSLLTGLCLVQLPPVSSLSSRRVYFFRNRAVIVNSRPNRIPSCLNALVEHIRISIMIRRLTRARRRKKSTDLRIE